VRLRAVDVQPLQMLTDHSRKPGAAGLQMPGHHPQRGGGDDFVGAVLLRGWYLEHASLLGSGRLAGAWFRAGGRVVKSNNASSKMADAWLFRQYQLVIAGNAQAIEIAFVADQDFRRALE
jgi:hypothetical protein